VEGEEGYREAKEFMRMLMPSQAKKIQAYREPTPLFIKAKVEDYLAQIYSPVVPLKSGGYLVINQTEALVAVDVNSGKATRERNVEATALKTNMEAAEEAARQLRLRDLAGLIVIDFIDMDEAKNNRAVEKKLKDCLKDDRARIQMGKISMFGLMEISRQRRRSGVLEGTTLICPHCQGVGRVRSVESSALSILRDVEMEAVRHGPGSIVLRAPADVALYILNEKRAYLLRLHQTQGLQVAVQIDETLESGHQIERISTLSEDEARAFTPQLQPAPLPEPEDDLDIAEEDDEEDEDEAAELSEEDELEVEEEDNEGGRSRGRPVESEGESVRSGRRRRRRRGRRGEEHDAPRQEEAVAAGAEAEGEDEGEDDHEGGEDGRGRRRRRRGRRGGRRAREDVRVADPYAWVRIRVPHSDGVYTWFDPALATTPSPKPAYADGDVTSPAITVEPPALAAPAAREGEEDVWVELPPSPPARAGRSRRGRGRGRDQSNDPATEAVAAEGTAVQTEPAPEADSARVGAAMTDPDPEAPAAKPRRGRSRAKAPPPEPVLEAQQPEPVLQPQPQPEREPVYAAAIVQPAAPPPAREPAFATPDPAEISSPPAEPKRGWWRRG
jgi:ribonuclease E